MDFDAVLRSSLSVVNDGYQLALSDLTDVVQGVSDAVKRNASEQFEISMSELGNDMKGSTYRIYFDTNVKNVRARLIDVTTIRIPSSGYPIFEGTYNKGTKAFFPDDEMNNKEEVAKLFVKLMQSPDSSLIQAIGYALRTKNNEDDEPF